MEVSDQDNAPAALPTGIYRSTHWRESWVGPTTRLEILQEKIPLTLPRFKPRIVYPLIESLSSFLSEGLNAF